MNFHDSPPDTLIEALMLINADELRPMLPHAGVPKPLPTRKADMAEAIARRLSGGLLRAAWDCLDATQQLAVGEVLHGHGGAFSANRFRARYGKLPEAPEASDVPEKYRALCASAGTDYEWLSGFRPA